MSPISSPHFGEVIRLGDSYRTSSERSKHRKGQREVHAAYRRAFSLPNQRSIVSLNISQSLPKAGTDARILLDGFFKDGSGEITHKDRHFALTGDHHRAWKTVKAFCKALAKSSSEKAKALRAQGLNIIIEEGTEAHQRGTFLGETFSEGNHGGFLEHRLKPLGVPFQYEA